MILQRCPTSDKDLQPITECVSDIGYARSRQPHPARPHHITQKVRLAAYWTLYFCVHDNAHPAEISRCLKDPDCTFELIGLYDVIAGLMSIALENLGEFLAGAKFEPCGQSWDPIA